MISLKCGQSWIGGACGNVKCTLFCASSGPNSTKYFYFHRLMGYLRGWFTRNPWLSCAFFDLVIMPEPVTSQLSYTSVLEARPILAANSLELHHHLPLDFIMPFNKHGPVGFKLFP